MSALPMHITAAHVGQKVPIALFEHATGTPGLIYELSRGTVVAREYPEINHAVQLCEVRDQVLLYRMRSGHDFLPVLGAAECKMLLRSEDLELRPELAIYLDRPPKPFDWEDWVPGIVAEVVAPDTRHRDYEEKPDEYLRFGVAEYWVVDRQENQMLVHRRVGGRWQTRVVKAPEVYETKLLPGLKVDVGAAFAAAAEYEG